MKYILLIGFFFILTQSNANAQQTATMCDLYAAKQKAYTESVKATRQKAAGSKLQMQELNMLEMRLDSVNKFLSQGSSTVDLAFRQYLRILSANAYLNLLVYLKQSRKALEISLNFINIADSLTNIPVACEGKEYIFVNDSQMDENGMFQPAGRTVERLASSISAKGEAVSSLISSLYFNGIVSALRINNQKSARDMFNRGYQTGHFYRGRPTLPNFTAQQILSTYEKDSAPDTTLVRSALLFYTTCYKKTAKEQLALQKSDSIYYSIAKNLLVNIWLTDQRLNQVDRPTYMEALLQLIYDSEIPMTQKVQMISANTEFIGLVLQDFSRSWGNGMHKTFGIFTPGLVNAIYASGDDKLMQQITDIADHYSASIIDRNTDLLYAAYLYSKSAKNKQQARSIYSAFEKWKRNDPKYPK